MSSETIYARDVAAITLVGGAGSRLGPFTWQRAKPAVTAGNSVLAAFSTSNAENSGVSRIVLAAQYLPRSLRRFYATVYGSNCGPERLIDLTDPLEYAPKAVYEGTADAFQKSMEISRIGDKKYVLGLSGDHVYKMDFQKIFEAFLQYSPKADFVIVSQVVPSEDVKRFGILFGDGTKVTNFKEKPPELPPGNYLASAGIYFASREVWATILKADRKKIKFEKGVKDPETQTEHDIGKDIIPYLLKNFSVYTFHFDGYWRDVGVPKALYDSYMDIFIRRNPDIMGDKKWKIAAIGEPQFHSNGHTYFTTGRFESKKAKLNGSVFSHGVSINSSEILDSILMGGTEHDTVINNSSIKRAILDKGVYVGNRVKLIAEENNLILVAKNTQIQDGTNIITKNDAIVAPLEEMVKYASQVIEFRKNVSPSLELYSPKGQKISFDELMEHATKK